MAEFWCVWCFSSLAGFVGLASAPTTVRNPSGWAHDRWTERTQGQRQASYRADDVRDCRGSGHRQRFRTGLPLSATLSRSGPREWQRDLRSVNGAAAHGQKRTIICLATIWTCGGRDGGVLMQRETREQGQCFKIECGLYLSSLWIRFQVNLYGVIILFLYSLSLAYI